MRGDKPGFTNKGFFSFFYKQWNTIIDEDYEYWQKNAAKKAAKGKLELYIQDCFMRYLHSHRNSAFSGFLSTTYDLRTALNPPFSDNRPEINVYVVKVPIIHAFKNPMGNRGEKEVVVTDYILQPEIIAEIPGTEAELYSNFEELLKNLPKRKRPSIAQFKKYIPKIKILNF